MSQSDAHDPPNPRPFEADEAPAPPDPPYVFDVVDADGRAVPCDLLEVLEVGRHDYAVLRPHHSGLDGGPTELLFYRVEAGEGGEEILVELDEPRELRRVWRAWKEWLVRGPGSDGRL